MKADEIQVSKKAQLGEHIGFHPRIVNEQSGINEICLALDLARTQARHQTVATHQSHAAARKPEAFPVPEAEDAAREIGTIEDRVETTGRSVSRVVVSRRPK